MPDSSSRQLALPSVNQTARESLVWVFTVLLVAGTMGCGGEPESSSTKEKPPASKFSASAGTEVDAASAERPSAGEEVVTGTDVAEEDVPTIAPEVVAKIQELYNANPKRPLPGDANAAAGNTYSDLLSSWFREHMIEAYKAEGDRDSRWDTAAVKILELELELNLKQLSGSQPVASTDIEIPELAPACDDPVVCSSYSALLHKASRTPEAEHWQRRALDAFEGSKYCKGAARRATMYVADSLRGRGREQERQQLLDRAVKETIEAAGDGSFANGYQRLFLSAFRSDIEGSLQDRREELLVALRTGADVDPWVGAMLRAQHHRDKGWEARGSGYAHTVTREGWKEFRHRLRLACAELVSAWQLHPEFPEAATKLIAVTMANKGVAGETTRFWFDEAVRAQFDYSPAYDALLWAYRPRWGGSHEIMESFALECVATERFDTNVPWVYIQTIDKIGRDLADHRMAYVRPGVFDRCQKVFDAYIEVSTERSRIDYLKSGCACVAWMSGEVAKAKELLDELGDRVQLDAFAVHGHGLAEVRKDLADPSGWAAKAKQIGLAARFQDANNECWMVVSVAGRSVEEYESALQKAKLVCENVPDNGMFLNTLGVAEYRAGKYAEAVATLTRSRQLNRESTESDDPADVAFLAMAYYRLGQSDEGLKCLRDLRALMKQPRWSRNKDAVTYLREAEDERLVAETTSGKTESREPPDS